MGRQELFFWMSDLDWTSTCRYGEDLTRVHLWQEIGG